jgi:hypothetical protein
MVRSLASRSIRRARSELVDRACLQEEVQQAAADQARAGLLPDHVITTTGPGLPSGLEPAARQVPGLRQAPVASAARWSRVKATPTPPKAPRLRRLNASCPSRVHAERVEGHYCPR